MQQPVVSINILQWPLQTSIGRKQSLGKVVSLGATPGSDLLRKNDLFVNS